MAFGLFRQGSHDLYPVTDCPLHHPRINEALQLLLDHFRQACVSAYNEVPLQRRSKGVAAQQSTGLLRYLQLTTCAADGNTQTHAHAPLQLVCVLNCGAADAQTAATAGLRKALKTLWASHGEHSSHMLFHSMWLNFQPSTGNRILGEDWVHLHGLEWARNVLCDTPLAIAPGSFVQVRPLSRLSTVHNKHTSV